MGVLSKSEATFEEVRQSSKFDEAWEDLKRLQPSLERFREPEDLRDFCRDASIPYEDQDPLVLALSIEAKREAEAKADRRFATDLRTWIFLPALWSVSEQASPTEILPPWEVEAEVLSGFWEMAIREHRTSEGLSGPPGYSVVGPTDHKTNRLELSAEEVNVSWSDIRTSAGYHAAQSERQRIRHAGDPAFHETPLRNLEKGRTNAWTKRGILEAIRAFSDRVGRSPSYAELRSANGLPDYKTIWRKFGSSRIAIEQAIRSKMAKVEEETS